MPKFKTHAERMKHPQAKLIPTSMWHDLELFYESLNDNVLSLMKAKSELLSPLLKRTVPKLNNQWLKKQAWLSIALSHPELDLSKLQEVATILQLSDTSLFSLFSILGKLPLLEEFTTKNPSRISDMISENGFYAPRKAAENGHFDVLLYLESIAPLLVPEMIKAGNFAIYKDAGRKGNLDYLIHLETIAPALTIDMIKAQEFYAYRIAAAAGQLAILEHLETTKPNLFEQMVRAEDYFAYRKATQNGYLEVSNWLLSKSSACLAYAEIHMAEYGEKSIIPFIEQQIRTLRRDALNTSAHGVFDLIDPEQAKICFYMLRNLIRRNDRALDDEIRFLLNIPSVKALAHDEVTPEQPNELIRLAIRTGNQEAASILLNIPEVRELTERNAYYRAEANGQLDCAQLAKDRESSMTALTIGEQKRLNDAIRHYRPILEENGISKLMDGLREQLRQRYEKNPASIINSEGHKITLPMDFSELQKLRLNKVDYEEALKAYYQHKDHSAWRYLEKPNPWMNPEAAYVYRNKRTGARWSTFEEYQPLIVLFWLAASDEATPATDGHTLESRLDHFIDELALIGRAHNWDKTRTNGQGKEEEYDDLTGDRPSCFSGVKRRLFQSVLGHPLISILTEDKILEEIRYFARDYFSSQIDATNKTSFKEAFDDFVINTNELDKTSQELLLSLNIPIELQDTFEHKLSTKYGAQYAEDFLFHKLVRDKLSLAPENKNFFDKCHALTLDGLTGLYQILNQSTVEEAEAEVAVMPNTTELRFFKSTPSEEILQNSNPTLLKKF